MTLLSLLAGRTVSHWVLNLPHSSRVLQRYASFVGMILTNNKIISNSLFVEQYLYFITFKMLNARTNHREIFVAQLMNRLYTVTHHKAAAMPMLG